MHAMVNHRCTTIIMQTTINASESGRQLGRVSPLGRDSLTFRGLPTEEILSQQHSLSGFCDVEAFLQLTYLDLELAEREVFISDLIILCSCADWFLRLLDGQQRKKLTSC